MNWYSFHLDAGTVTSTAYGRPSWTTPRSLARVPFRVATRQSSFGSKNSYTGAISANARFQPSFGSTSTIA